MRKLLLILFPLLCAIFPTHLSAYAHWEGYCQQGGQKVVTSSVQSTTSVQQSYPQATLTVYLTGTGSPGTKATLYSDNAGTPLANPLTCSTRGYFSFYADNSSLDLTFSGTGISAPFTWGAVQGMEPLGVISDYSPPNSLTTLCNRAAAANQSLLLTQQWTGLTTQTLNCPSIVGLGGFVQPASGQTVTMTIQSAPLSTLCNISAGGHCIINTMDGIVYPQWFGGPADNTTDIYPAVQAASDAIPNGGEVRFVSGSYKFSGGNVIPTHSYQTFNWETGAIMTYSSVPFLVSNTSYMGLTPSAPVTLTTGLQGASTITIASTAGITAGRRIVISAGTFDTSGVEEGPWEFNTVESITNGTQLTTQTALRYSYSAFGLPMAAPRIYLLPVNYLHDIKFIGKGTLQAAPTFDSAFVSMRFTENMELSGLHFHNIGNVGVVGGESSRMRWYNTTWDGVPFTSSSSGYDIMDGSLAESWIYNNVFNLQEIFGSGTVTQPFNQINHLICEETCRDNYVMDNIFGPISNDSAAAIDFTNHAFNNHFLDNQIWGRAQDIVANVQSIGIQTSLFNYGANEIRGNTFTNINLAIYDGADQSVITGNVIQNSSLNASSAGLILINNSTPLAQYCFGRLNIFVNVATPCTINGGGLPGTPTIQVCDGVSHAVCGVENGAGTAGTAVFFGDPTDQTMFVQLVTGASGATASKHIFVITFAYPFTGTGAACLLSPVNQSSVAPQLTGAQQVAFTGFGGTTLILQAGTTPLSAGQVYQWAISCPPHK